MVCQAAGRALGLKRQWGLGRKGGPQRLMAGLGDSSPAATTERPGVPGPEAQEETVTLPPIPRLSLGFLATRGPRERAHFGNQTDWVEFWNGHLLSHRRLLYESPSPPYLSTSERAGA